MNVTEKLRQWGVAHAAARAAERSAAQQPTRPDEAQRTARELREQADRLHGEIYTALGRRIKPGHPGVDKNR